MNEVLLDSASVTVVTGARLKHVTKDGSRIISVTLQNGDVYEAPIWLDCSYEGDLAAMAGVTMSYGRDSWHKYPRADRAHGHRHLEAGAQYRRRRRTTRFQVGRPATATSIPGAPGRRPPWEAEMSPSARSQAYGWRFCLSKRSRPAALAPAAGLQPPGVRLGRGHDHQQRRCRRHLPAAALRLRGVGHWLRHLCLQRRRPRRASSPIPGRRPPTTSAIAIQGARLSVRGRHLVLRRQRSCCQRRAYRTNLNGWGLPAAEFQADFIGSPGWPSAYYVRQARTMVGQYVDDHGRHASTMAAAPTGTNPTASASAATSIDAHPYYWYPTPDLLDPGRGQARLQWSEALQRAAALDPAACRPGVEPAGAGLRLGQHAGHEQPADGVHLGRAVREPPARWLAWRSPPASTSARCPMPPCAPGCSPMAPSWPSEEEEACSSAADSGGAAGGGVQITGSGIGRPQWRASCTASR